MDVIKWNDFTFHVNSSSIIPTKDISVSMSVETESKTKSNENYVKKKNLNPAEISLTGAFSAALGVGDVRGEVFRLADKCRRGDTGYVYCGSAKLMPPQFMGVSAKIGNIQIAANGEWTYCEVQVTLKQCEKYGGGTSGGGKSTKKKKGTKGKAKTTGANTNKNTMDKGSYNERKKQLQQAKETAKATAAAKKQSSGYTPTKYTGTKKASAGGGGGTWRAATR